METLAASTHSVLKIELCDASGNNLSSSSITVHAVSVMQVSTNTPAMLDDTGNANPDFDFRYDPSLAGYLQSEHQRICHRHLQLEFHCGQRPSRAFGRVRNQVIPQETFQTTITRLNL
jgi:hypothetical protein